MLTTEIPIIVEFTAMWREPSARLTVRPRVPGLPLTAETVRYVREMQHALQREFSALLTDTNAAGLRQWSDQDLEAMVRGKLLKAARGEIRLDNLSISEEHAATTPVRLTDR
jgi:hypothetical protein